MGLNMLMGIIIAIAHLNLILSAIINLKAIDEILDSIAIIAIAVFIMFLNLFRANLELIITTISNKQLHRIMRKKVAT
jgi:hypothetical protein